MSAAIAWVARRPQRMPRQARTDDPDEALLRPQIGFLKSPRFIVFADPPTIPRRHSFLATQIPFRLLLFAFPFAFFCQAASSGDTGGTAVELKHPVSS